MLEEPTILDYLRSLLGYGVRIELDSYFQGMRDRIEPEAPEEKKTEKTGKHPGRKSFILIIGLLTAILAQYLLEPPDPNVSTAIPLYALSIFLILQATHGMEVEGIGNRQVERSPANEIQIRTWAFAVGLLLLISAFILFGGNEFTILNVSLWLAGAGLFVYSVWQTEARIRRERPSSRSLMCAVILIAVISLFFRFYQLNSVPGEMFSDHAEKLYDVMDVLAGRTPIFFIRNTGREPLQFYLTAAIIKIFQTGISFISLKLGTAAAGWITLIYIYLLGKEMAGGWTGAAAAFFAGIAYWPNVISRVGLRFSLYPLFTAPVLLYVFRGLRERRLNPLIIAGICLGLGLHGYSPFRIVPILVSLIFIVFAISNKEIGDRKFALTGFILLAFTSMVIFLPLLRYLLDNPGNFNFRLASRLTSLETPITGPVLLVFLQNMWRSFSMFFYRNGVIWVNSIPDRPALDIFSAAFFFIGLVFFLLQLSNKKKNWQSISLLISIPVLMLPSILSLAYPSENPSLNRSGGTIIPVFTICAVGFTSIISFIQKRVRDQTARLFSWVLLGTTLIGSIAANYDLVFHQYADQFLRSAWNSSEIGAQIAEFVEEGNNPQNAFVVPYPHWVDTRLVGIHAGFPGVDYALWTDDLPSHSMAPGDKLFIIKPEDGNALVTIKSLYPQAREGFLYSKTPGKDFIVITVDE